jgi:aryl-alcohol dehydrogenase-like predicted oxidoreductase
VTGAQTVRQQVIALPGDGGAARIILGGRFGEEPTDLSWRRLDRFADLGGKVVDTAHSYAGGLSEKVIGEWMRANPGMLTVVDKIGHPDGRGVIDLSASVLRRELAESRDRLGDRAPDVVLLHRDSPEVPVEEVAVTLADLVANGEAREIGVSNWPAHRLDHLVTALAKLGRGTVASYQRSLAVPVAPLWPGTLHAAEPVLEVTARHRLPMLAWAAQARGFFAGATELPDAGRPDPFISPANLARRSRCEALARDLGSRPETVALAWLLHHPGTWAIVGARSVPEVDASLAASRLSLDAATLRWLENGTR